MSKTTNTNNIKFNWTQLIFYVIMLGVFPLIFIITKNEWIIALWTIILIGIIWLVKYNNKEWILVVVGIILGIIGEKGGDMIYQLQYWNSGSFFGIPIWLPIIWGFGFLLMYRIGRLIVKE